MQIRTITSVHNLRKNKQASLVKICTFFIRFRKYYEVDVQSTNFVCNNFSNSLNSTRENQM